MATRRLETGHQWRVAKHVVTRLFAAVIKLTVHRWHKLQEPHPQFAINKSGCCGVSQGGPILLESGAGGRWIVDNLRCVWNYDVENGHPVISTFSFSWVR